MKFSQTEFEDCTEDEGFDRAGVLDGNLDQCLEVCTDNSRIPFLEAESRWKVDEKQEEGKPFDFWHEMEFNSIDELSWWASFMRSGKQ
jgi:hypothetical protein